MKETTIAKTLRHIKAALRWGERMGLMQKAPSIIMPKRVKGQSMMKGRPITGEEFDRLLAAVPKIRPLDAPAWQAYLTGLWLSGLRLSESLVLSWDAEAPFAVDFSGRRPVFRIRGEAQKSGRDEILPMTPDFAEWLQATYPEAERVGRVFKLTDDAGIPLEPLWVSKKVADMGEVAGIIVNKQEGKYASCHDLRRAFGNRWARKVTSAVLMRLMRHGDIQTTMNYYVDLDAGEIADTLWQGFEAEKKQNGNTCGNTQQIRATDPYSVNDISP
ncbi:MAG: site-specific integrase [Pirellulales bacterium]|nr:site-specific integrase [Pirellulales bacterium]